MSPLSGIRVVELGQLVAGPFAGAILGYFGARVIKIEAPGGDPLRGWRSLDETGTSYWWRSIARNKKSVCIDLRKPRGQQLVRDLVGKSDVLIENFRPGTLERWNLDPQKLQKQTPALIVARVSGYGQDGPYSHRPGYASVCEAEGGLRHLTGKQSEIPVRANLSLGDSLAGLHAALGITMSLFHRTRSGLGQTVDTAITESVFNMLEAVVPEYAATGVARAPSGTTVTGIAPTGTYRCMAGELVVIGANGDSVFRRLCAAMGNPTLADDTRFASNSSRVAHIHELDSCISQWTSQHSQGEVLSALEAASVPAGPINSAAELVRDPHFIARELFEVLSTAAGEVTLPAMAPKLSATPGSTLTAGPPLGEHTREVLQGDLGLSDEHIDQLCASGVVSCASAA